MSYDLLNMDVRAGLASLPERHFHTCVTSPPYWGLRDYGVAGQLGLEPTIDQYIANMVEVCRGIGRVLRDDGTMWLNIGDSYTSGGRKNRDPGQSKLHPAFTGEDNETTTNRADTPDGLKPKDLCGIPWRLVLALQADGWYWRSTICWAKRSPMPESVTDRPTSAWEPIFLLSKSERYYYDATAVREPQSQGTHERFGKNGYRSLGRKPEEPGKGNANNTSYDAARTQMIQPDACRNLRNFWLLSSEPCKDAHFATFPSIIPHRAIAAGTSERGCCPECGAGWKRIVATRFVEQADSIGCSKGGQKGMDATNGWGSNPRGTNETTTTGWKPTCECNSGEPAPCRVLEPFAGSGTTLLEAIRMGRDATGIELNPAYVEIIRRRIDKHAPLFAALA